MIRINLAKYGFVRWPEEDFSDDGNRFTCYRAGKAVRVSKLVSDGQAYLSASSMVGDTLLPHDIYSKLPNYHASNWSFNGISVDSLTDEMLHEFFRACVAYEQEYEAAVAAMAWPSREEIMAKAGAIQLRRLSELNIIQNLFNNSAVEIAVKLSDSGWKDLRECIVRLTQEASHDPSVVADRLYGQCRSIDFLKSTADSTDIYWFTRAIELIEKAKKN